jgi:hypothetical protein
MRAHAGLAHRSEGRDRGQSTVELALVMPLVVLLLLLVVQVGVLVHDQLLVTAAAREAVRAAAVSPHDDDARHAAATVGRLDPGRLRVEILREGGEGSLVRVRVSYVAPTAVPMVGLLVGDQDLAAVSVMRAET